MVCYKKAHSLWVCFIPPHFPVRSDRASEALGQLGAIQDILAAMRDDPDNSGLVATCCNALWALTILGRPHALLLCGH